MHRLQEAVLSASLDDLADAARDAYRTALTQAITDGRATHLVIPYSLLGPFIVPTLWLAIPHRRRPWLYQTRWLVMAFVIAFDVDLVRRASSTNIACAYAVGLMASWGIVATMNLLIWKKPQFEAARVMRRVKTPSSQDPAISFIRKESRGQDCKGLRLRNDTKAQSHAEQGDDAANEIFEHYWQTFPEEASFLDRLCWVIDLTVSFRFSGWNWSISALPHPEIPHGLRDGMPVNLNDMPVASKSGFKRCTSTSHFVRLRLWTLVVNYLILDFLSVFMMKDPYFILSPDYPYRLPEHLQDVHHWLLRTYRQLFGLAAAYSAIAAIFAASDLAQFWVLQYISPGRGELWMFASTFGSLSNILDRGLAGWWASWWHQTFRAQFLAPAAYLTRRGFLERGTRAAAITTLFVSFAQSGLLHMSGSATSLPQTKLWRSPVFFTLQAVGICVQYGLAFLIQRRFANPPRWLCRTANALFAATWLNLTASLFIDDLSAAQLWLLEPVPISLLRLLGYGHGGDHWWRFGPDHFPRWHSAERWWQSGIAL